MIRYCKKRGHSNLAGHAGSKRYLFWMVVSIAAACSVLRGRAAFANVSGISARTLLQRSFSATVGMC